MAIAAERGMKVHQLDVQIAHLNGNLEGKVYMELPENAIEILQEISKENSKIGKKARKMLHDIDNGKETCELQKSLYGLKQSGREWNKKLHRKLINMGISI